MELSEIMKTVEKIRAECDLKTQDEQLAEHRAFFESYSALFFMARDKSMSLDTFRWMISLKHRIDRGAASQNTVDAAISTHFYEKYVAPKVGGADCAPPNIR
jgi:hypothetical protein